MRLLFEMDLHDYADCTHNFVRNSARSIIVRDKKVAMIHSLKYDYYKFPGGGIEGAESTVDAMIRETCEEAGLIVKPETVKEFGLVHRIQRSDKDPTECLVQDNFYYLCDADDEIVPQHLDHYEAAEHYALEFVAPTLAIHKNRNVQDILESYAREKRFTNLTWFIDDGYSGTDFNRPGIQKLLAEVEAGRVSTIIVKDLSRFSRNSAMAGMYINFTFAEQGVRFGLES